ncbi:Flp pilus assembly protein CpaB [Devosia sp.]|uniref:Flp pilus assembly protein CpaB n=1 Tax=Devosia sp. TaxID=1871048 RepID=UPI00326625EE
MKPARIILLAVALLAGGLAAFLVMRGGGQPAPQIITTEVTTQEAKVQILVAKAAIGTGERLTPETVEWQDWPEGAVRPEYVNIATMPDAPTKLTGSVVRFEFFPGEPIRQAKLVSTDQGYLSAVLSKGMRGVSVPVDAASSAGGFVVPNDRVDVLLTQATPTGQSSQVVLTNVRVLAIGKRLGELGASGGATAPAPEGGPQAQVFDSSTIATLELDPSQTETLVNAKALGTLSLALRSIADFTDTTDAAPSANQAVRLIRYGKELSVTSSATPLTVQQGMTSAPIGGALPTVSTQVGPAAMPLVVAQ